MPLTPNQIEMWGNFFQTFFQIFAIIFTEKGNMQQNISFIFIFVVCVKFSHKNINDWLKPPKIQRIKSSTDTHMARNNIITHI